MSARRSVRPTGQELVDATFLLVLIAGALVGFATSFTGWSFLVVGLVGALLGIVIAHVCSARGLPVAVTALVALVVFLLFGGPLCLRSEGSDSMLPVPDTLRALTDQLIFGWKDLLTTLPPVDGDGPLLVLPWLLGLAAGVLGVLLCRVSVGPLWLRSVLPLLAPLSLLAGVILLGTTYPQSLLIQGAVFAAVALGWLGVRAQRATGPTHGSTRGTSRALTGALMIALATVLAIPLAAVAVGADADRTVLRDHVAPPFDIGQYQSPLASFRRYVKMPQPDSVNLYNKPLFSVDGVPAGTRVRFASLDQYDGVVWGAANRAAGAPDTEAGTFQRVSSTIDNPTKGKRVDVSVTLDKGWSGVWLPTVGALESMHFDGSDADTSADSFRYNLASSTAVVPSGLREGDAYHFEAVLPDESLSAKSAPATAVGPAANAAAFLDTQATQWTAGEQLPMRRVFAAAEHLKQEGKYSDGVLESERIYHPGHNLHRLSDEFVNAPIMVGNDEQYAAVMALLANRIGVPARVVMGAVVPEGGVVTGKDVEAWVELQVADGSWRTLPTSTFMDYDRPAEQPPQTEQQMSGVTVPPPAPVPPPSIAEQRNDAELRARIGDRDSDEGGGLPGWVATVLMYAGGPLLAVLLVIGTILGAKAMRRRRRRTAAKISARFVGAWRELVDHARDLGQPIPVAAGVTRREQSRTLAAPASADLAREADGHVFGPDEPEADSAASYWSRVDEERRAMSAAVPWRRRWWAAITLRSFRRR